ncbi:futalosine hydrolase [Streptomyces sp. OfavH-34-F]|uniref:futalosine hydrolase n=1 Tax=Streptomyces sp. OfavH-34-F TaxID=2917760 RepID=UPI001EF3350A|nr:futalosine hydrolase [Streptomyces sp. OfavH-34-F]MCG7528223.1 futalosine hydrolase [Streptomyces sp. OfavH-34-F]
MRVLVVTAVPVERDAVTRAYGDEPEVRPVRGAEIHRAGPLDVLAGGAGPAAAAASAAFALASGHYGLVVSAGIGGGFAPVAPVGSLVVSRRIGAADLGAETPAGFVPVTELGFGRTWHFPPRSLVRAAAGATGAAAGDILTVSTVTGSADRAAALLAAHPGALAEAMEGFGVAEAADLAGVPVLEIRAVSNAVGPRDRDAWRIGDALTALTGAFGKLIPVLEGWTRHDRDDTAD